MQLLFNQLLNEIDRAGRFLFICHRNPDTDTVGSALALGNFIEARGKRVDYFCVNKIPNNFLILKNAKRFTGDIGVFEKNYDAIIFIDCAESGRCGVPDILQYKKQKWLSIDHHSRRENFSDFEIRDQRASATAEIIFKFFLHLGEQINPDTATLLLAGILIDTDFLSNAGATDESVKMAGELSALGADWRGIVSVFHLNKNHEILKLWGNALSRLKYHEEKKMATTVIFKNEILESAVLDDATSGFSSFLCAILQTDIIIVFEERGEDIRGSLRTAKDNIDVAKIAGEYGGGGHAKAAGFTCQGKIVERENEWGVEKTVR